MQVRRDWIWISGNHDPALPSDLGGMVATEVAIGPIVFRHEPSGAYGEIAGHLHPKARVPTRGRSIERRCFACDGDRAVMPAFGAYAGGLSIRDAAFAKIFGTPGFMAHVLGDSQSAHDRGVALLLSVSHSSFRGAAAASECAIRRLSAMPATVVLIRACASCAIDGMTEASMVRQKSTTGKSKNPVHPSREKYSA